MRMLVKIECYCFSSRDHSTALVRLRETRRSRRRESRKVPYPCKAYIVNPDTPRLAAKRESRHEINGNSPFFLSYPILSHPWKILSTTDIMLVITVHVDFDIKFNRKSNHQSSNSSIYPMGSNSESESALPSQYTNFFTSDKVG